MTINGVVLGSVYGIIALGFSIIYGTTRVFHFAHGGVYACSVYFVYIFLVKLSFPLPLVIPASMVLAALLGVVIDYVVYEPLIDVNAKLCIQANYNRWNPRYTTEEDFVKLFHRAMG